MSPPVFLPRLRTIDPNELAKQVYEDALLRLRGDCQVLGISGSGSMQAPREQAPVWRLIQNLYRYAMHGDAGTMDPVAGDIEGAVTMLSSLRPSAEAEDLLSDHDSHTPLGVLLRAASARARLARGQEVPLSWLAALVGTTLSHTKRMLDRSVDQIPGTAPSWTGHGRTILERGTARGTAKAAPAIVWLREKGVENI